MTDRSWRIYLYSLDTPPPKTLQYISLDKFYYHIFIHFTSIRAPMWALIDLFLMFYDGIYLT